MIPSLFAGMVAGQASLACVQPLDFIRTKLQTSTHAQYTGVIDCVQKTIKKEGIRSFYRGMAVPFAAQGVYKAVMFSSFETGSSYFKAQNEKNGLEKNLSPFQLATCGAMAGSLNSLVVTPVEMIRNNLIVSRKVQQDLPQQTKLGVSEIVKRIYAENGIKGFWKGQLSCTIRDFFGVGAYFYGNNRMNAYLSANTNLSPAAIQILSGSFAGICFWTVSLPMDRIKSIIQTQTENKNIAQVVQYIIHQEGFKGLYRGLPAGLFRGIPAAAITFFTYGTVMNMLGKR